MQPPKRDTDPLQQKVEPTIADVIGVLVRMEDKIDNLARAVKHTADDYWQQREHVERAIADVKLRLSDVEQLIKPNGRYHGLAE